MPLTFRPLLFSVWLGLGLAAFAPAQASFEAGRDYLVLNPAQNVETRGKIEVLEFFWYRCPHCRNFEPELAAWRKRLGRDVVAVRQPAILADHWEPLARVYYTLEALGAADRLHAAVFDAVQIQGHNLNDAETFFDWAAAQGLNRDRVKDAYHSFSVASKVNRARQITRSYRLDGVPAVAVNGKYLTSASFTGSHARTLEVVDALIEQERRASRGQRR